MVDYHSSNSLTVSNCEFDVHSEVEPNCIKLVEKMSCVQRIN